MKLIRNRTSLVSIMLLSGCVSAGQVAYESKIPSPTEFEVATVDNTEMRRFDVRVTSRTDRQLCIRNEEWPDGKGRFSDSTLNIFVQTPEGKISLKPALMSAYCPGGCGEKHIGPHEILVGFISYDAFESSEKVVLSNERTIHFPLNVYFCR